MGFAAESQAGLITFDDLPSPPATDGATGLFFANNKSALYGGVTWDPRVNVVGDAYRVDTATPGPLFGIPHSGDFFITNGGEDNDGILLTTDQVLLGAWFGRNEYYGFGSGADRVTINALGGATVLDSVVFDLPAPSSVGQPGLMGFADTGRFSGLTGITGYRIDRHELGSQTGNWVADDFSFAPVSTPEPSSLRLSIIGLLALNGKLLMTAIRRRNKKSSGSGLGDECRTDPALRERTDEKQRPDCSGGSRIDGTEAPCRPDDLPRTDIM
jgi:hypothetical protein